MANDPQAVAVALLVERLATFLKACFIYPDNNVRVQATGEAVLESLRQQLARRPLVEIVVGSHDLVVAGVRLPLRSHAQSWLRDLFVRTLIGGLEFTPAADQSSLTAAARRLQKAQVGKERGLGLWAEPIAGVRARELIMSGSHDDAEVTESDAHTEMVGKRGARLRALEATLAASKRVQESVARLRALMVGWQSDNTGTSLDLIAELVRCLPAEANHDHAYAEKLAEQILSAATTELAGLARDQAIERDLVAATFLSVGQKLFQAMVAKNLPAAQGGRGHGDETVSDSLPELLHDLQELAATMPKGEEPITAGSAAEVVGVILHALTQGQEGEQPGLRAHLGGVLGSGGADAAEVLRQYYEVALSSQDGEQRPIWRVVALAHDPAVRAALSKTPLLAPESVARFFPRTLPLFLDTLGEEDAAGRLGALCRLLGPEHYAAAAPWLAAHAAEFDERRLDALFAAMSPRALTLAGLVLQYVKIDVKPAITKFLRQLGLSGAASVALRVIDPPSRLPREYLEQLCKCVAAGQSASAELAHLSGSLTRAFIKALAGQPDQEARRIFAIQGLRELPSSESRVMLKEILSAHRGLFWLKRESRAVRRAARDTLAALGKMAPGRGGK